MHDKVQMVITEVLRPLLERDDSGIELVTVTDSEIVVEVSGRAAFGVGAEYVQTGVIEPALRKVVGDGIKIHVKKALPKAKKRKS